MDHKGLTLKSVDSVRRELITSRSRKRDNQRVTALNRGGTAKVRAFVDIGTLGGDVGCEKSGWWRTRAKAENRNCPSKGYSGKLAYGEAHGEEVS